MYFFFVQTDTFFWCAVAEIWTFLKSLSSSCTLSNDYGVCRKFNLRNFFTSNQLLFVCTVTSQMLLLYATSCSKGKITSLIFYKVELGIKGCLFFLFQMWVIYCIILHSLHIQYVTCQKVFQFLASTSMLPFASHFSISISILFIHRNTFCIWFINSTQQYLCTPLHVHNKWVMKDCRAKTVYYLHYMRLWIHHIHSHFCSLQQSEYFPHFKRRSCWNTNLHSFNITL